MPGKLKNPYYIAQDIISRRDHSEFEIRAKMQRKGFTTREITDSINKLKKLGLVNDAKFAHLFAQGYIQSKPVGRRYLDYKLREKGLKSSLIETTLDQVFTPEVEKLLLKKATEKWHRRNPTHKTDTQRLTRYLISRGFSPTTIADAELSQLSVDESQTSEPGYRA